MLLFACFLRSAAGGSGVGGDEAFTLSHFHVTSSPPCWWTKTKDLSLAFFVRPPALLSVSREIGCEPPLMSFLVLSNIPLAKNKNKIHKLHKITLT